MALSKLRLFIASKPGIQRVLKVGKTVFSPKYLLYTNVIVSGQLSAFGDIIQQTYQHSKPDNTESWDVKRTAKMFATGIILCPFVHAWYLYLDRFLPGNTVKIVLTKMVPDLVLFSPSYVILFLFVTGALEGQSISKFKKEVKDKFIGLFSVELFLWTPAQFINFSFLPSRFRVLYDNIISLVADVLYSYFRYDYKVGDEESESESESKSKEIKEKEKILTEPSLLTNQVKKAIATS